MTKVCALSATQFFVRSFLIDGNVINFLGAQKQNSITRRFWRKIIFPPYVYVVCYLHELKHRWKISLKICLKNFTKKKTIALKIIKKND
jgi:hypothetical protein